MERDQASKFINDLLQLMVSRNGSDLFITAEFPPAIKVDGKITKVSPQPLTPLHTLTLARSIMSDKQIADFERTKESNFAISPAGIGRFRVNAIVWPAPSDCAETLVILPSTLMAGGNSAVMNRSLPLRLTMSLSRSLMNWLA